MARKTDIRLRRSATAGNKPSTSDLNLGELALNTYDGAVFLKTHDGSSDAIAVAADARTLSIDYDNKRVGIGTTTPSYKLNVQTGASDANNDWPALFKSSDDKAGIIISDNDTSNYLVSRNSFLSIGSNADLHANNLNVKSTGEVGIGTTTPSHELVIRKDQAADTEVSIVNLNDNDNASALLRFRNNTSGSETASGAYIQLNKFNAFRIWNQFGNPILFGTSNAEKMRLDADGNLGIGTNNPTEPLHIVNSDPKIRLQDSDGTNQFATIFQNGGQLVIQSRNITNNVFISFKGHNGTSATEFGRFNMSGNLGIATSSPSGGKLVVQTVSGEYGLRLQDNSGHYFRVAHGGATEIAGDVTINAGLRVNNNPVILDTNPSNTYGVSEALRIDDSAGTTDRALQIFELLHSGSRSHRLTFNTNITSDGSAYTYTQGNYGGSSQIEFGNNGNIKFYTVNQQSGGSTTAITPIERFRIAEEGDILFEGGNLFYDASANALNFIDNVYAQFGSSNDLQIYHTGADSYIKNITGNLILDATNDIVLDADGGDILLKDDGTNFGKFANNSGSLHIVAIGADNDIKFFGNDGGSSVTALHLDMSDAGKATFNSGVTTGGVIIAGANIFRGNMQIASNEIDVSTGNLVLDVEGGITLDSNGGQVDFKDNGTLKALIDFTGNNVEIQSRVTDGDLLFRGQDGASFITALSLDMSDAGSATFNNDVTIGGNLIVNGSTTTINSTTLDVDDLNITVAKGAADSSAASGGGLTIDGAGASLIWDHGNQYLEFNKDVFTSSSFIIGTTSTNVGRMYNSSGVMALEAYTSRQISFGNATNGEFVRINATGNVGIGITNPSRKFVVRDSGAQMSLLSDTDGSSVINFGDTADDNAGRIHYNNDTDAMFIRTATVDRITILSSGNVGIGTTTPGRKLDVSSGGSDVPQIRASYNSTNYLDLKHNLINAVSSGGNDALQLQTAGTTGLMIDVNQNVGIGTISPSTALEIGDGTGSPILTLNKSTTGESAIDFDNAGNIKAKIALDSAETLQFKTGNSPTLRMQITEAGVISFGNNAYSFPTSDGSAGHVLKTDGSGTLSFGTVTAGAATALEDADGDTKIQVEEGTDDDTIRFDTGGTERALFNQNGLNIKNSGGLRIGGTEVISSARNATFASTVTIGSGNEAITLGTFNSGQSDITGLVGGSTFGSLITGGNNAHVVVKLKDNDVGDSFSVVSGGGNFMTDSTSDTLALRVKASGETSIGGNTSISGSLTTTSTVKVDPASGDAIVQMEGAGGAQILRIDQNSIRTSTSSDLSIFTSGNTRQIFLDQSAANIGFNMGSDSPHPGTAVHIKGHDTTPDFTANSIDDCTLVLSNSDDDYGTIFGQLGTGTGVIQARRLASAVYYNLALNPHGGKVGINQVAPLRTLEVGGAGATMRVGPDYFTLDGSTDRDYIELQAHGTDSRIVAPNEKFHIENTSGDIVLTASGGIGIGTTAPQSKLETNLHSGSDSSLMNANSVNDVHLIRAGFGQNAASTSNAGAKWGLRFVGRNDSNYDNGKSGAIFGVSEDSLGYNRKVGLAFHTSAFDASHAERMRINADGNVGIGTTSPARKLHVVGSGATIAVKAEATDGNQSSLDLKNSEGEFRLINDGGSLSIYDQTDTAERFRINTSGNVGIGTSSPDTRLDVTAAGVQGLIINQDTSNAAVSARMFFKDNVRTNGFLNVNGVLEVRTGMVIGSTSGTKIIGVGPTQVEITRPVIIEEYQIDTAEVSTSSTTQTVIAQSNATIFRSCRYTVQITNSTDSTYHTTELLLVHDGTTANITEFGTIFTGAAVEATFDADIVSGNIRLLATPASGDTMVFKTIKHSVTV